MKKTGFMFILNPKLEPPYVFGTGSILANSDFLISSQRSTSHLSVVRPILY